MKPTESRHRSFTRPLMTFMVAAGILTGTPVVAQVSQSDTILTKGLMYTQTSQSTPVQATQNAAILEASLPGLDGPAGGLNPSASLTLPSSSTISVPYNATDLAFFFSATNNTTSGLNATYPSGNYTLKLTSSFLRATNVAALPANNFPTPPEFSNYSAAQQIDSTQDFNLTFTAFSGAASPDDSTITIYDSGGSVVLTDTPTLGGTSYTISGGTLSSGQTYSVHLRYRQLTTTTEMYFSSAVGFFSETVMNIATTGGSVTTPPTLTNSVPATGQIISAATSPLLLQFSEAMNQTVAIQWTETINGASVPLSGSSFAYFWTSSSALACFYGSVGGTWPGGAVFSWVLNPVASASSNFTSTTGQPLASDTYSGNFITPGGPFNCLAQTNDPIEATAFSIVKAANYVQTGPNAPVPDPNLGGQLLALFQMPENGNVSSPALIILQLPPTSLPVAGGDVLTENETSADLSAGHLNFMYAGSASGATGLDSAYPAGSYTVEMATANSGGSQLPPIPTNSVSLNVAGGSYPPVPQLTNSTVLPLTAVTNNLTVSWLPWAGPSAGSYISLEIIDSSSNVVFSAPDLCSNLPLPASSTSVVVPSNTLSAGVAYQIVLSFLSLSDSNEYMPGIPGAGYAALASVTRMKLSAYLSPPPVVAITAPTTGAYLASGAVIVHVTASQPHGYLTGLQLFSGTSSIASLPIGVGTNSFSGTISGSLPPGPQNLYVTATDNNGQTATAGPVPVMAQSSSFVVSLTSPAQGAAFAPFPNIPLAASASSPNGAITNLNFFMDGNPVASLNGPPFSYSVPQVAPGVHQFYVQAFDVLGFGGQSSLVTVTVAAPAQNYMAAFSSTNGSLSFGFTGAALSSYVLEATTNLTAPVNWTPVQSKIISSAAAVFSDANYASYITRYYRVAPLSAFPTNAPAFSVWSQTDPQLSVSDSYEALDGALLSLTNTNGTVFTLSIPPAGLGLSQPVTMTTVTNLQDYPFAGPMIAAVELAPSEVELFNTGTLTIQLPTNVAPASVAAFSYHVPNGELYLVPFTVTNVVTATATNPAIAIQLNRCGGYGIATLTTADLSLAFPNSPTDPSDSLDQSLALYGLDTSLVPADHHVKDSGPSAPGGPTVNQMVQQLLDQFNVIYAQMQADEASGTVNNCDLVTWQRWLQDVEAFNAQEGQNEFTIQLAEFAQALANIYQVAITKLITEADSQHDWNTLTKLLLIDSSGKLNNEAVASGWQPGQLEALQEALDECLTFEFDFDTSLVNDSSIGTETSHLTAQVSFMEGNPSMKGMLKGAAAVQWQEANFPPISMCNAVTSSPNTPNLNMFGILPAGSPTMNGNCSSTYNITGMEAIFWPNFPMENFTTSCDGYPVNFPSYWFPEFGIIYENDLQGYPAHGAIPQAAFFVQDGWQIQGGGGNPVLATRQGSGHLNYQNATITETSTWTVKHTPF